MIDQRLNFIILVFVASVIILLWAWTHSSSTPDVLMPDERFLSYVETIRKSSEKIEKGIEMERVLQIVPLPPDHKLKDELLDKESWYWNTAKHFSSGGNHINASGTKGFYSLIVSFSSDRKVEKVYFEIN